MFLRNAATRHAASCRTSTQPLQKRMLLGLVGQRGPSLSTSTAESSTTPAQRQRQVRVSARMVPHARSRPAVAASASSTAATASGRVLGANNTHVLGRRAHRRQRLFSSASSAGAAAAEQKSEVPLIDLSGCRGPDADPARQKAVAAQIKEACERIGFFGVTGHGVDLDLIKRMDQVTRSFFDLPVEEKSVQMTKDYPYGYIPLQHESLAKGYEAKAAKGDGNPYGTGDLNESFAVGSADPASGLAPRRWPEAKSAEAERVMKDVKEVWPRYYDNLVLLSRDMLRLFALALEVPDNFFDECLTRHRSALRLLNHPALDFTPPPDAVRVGQHTDYGAITILHQDETGGLQTWNRQKEWVDIPPVFGAFVINLGDLMQMWTNDRWVSNNHRVVIRHPEKRRVSIAFFCNINHDHMVECIPSCTDAQHPPKYPPVLAWEHLQSKHTKSTTTE